MVLFLVACQSMRGLTLVRVLGLEMAAVKGVGVKLELRTTALTMEASPMLRRSVSRKKEAFLLMGPLTLPPKRNVWYGGILETKGLGALNTSSLTSKRNWPWN